MTLNGKMTNLADQFRNAYGVPYKFGISDMIAGFTGLEAKNYLDFSKSPNDGNGSFTTDPTQDQENLDIMRTYPVTLNDGIYSLSWDMKGNGNFTIYAWPINKSYGECHKIVDLTDSWEHYSLTFTVTDLAVSHNQPAFFVRVNSDHESKHFEVKNWKLVKLK